MEPGQGFIDEMFENFARGYIQEHEDTEDLDAPVFALRAFFYRPTGDEGVEYKSRLLGNIDYDRDSVKHMRTHIMATHSTKSSVRAVAAQLAQRCALGRFANQVYECTLGVLQDDFPGEPWNLSALRIVVLSEAPF